MTYPTTTATTGKNSNELIEKRHTKKMAFCFYLFARVADAVIHLLHGQNEPVTI